MGVLIDGKWTDGELPQETSETGQFKRADSVFRDRITADGSSGFKAEPGRYHLYVAHGCPVGAPHADLSRAEEARWADLGRLFDPRPEEAGLDLRATIPRYPGLHPRTRSTAFSICYEAYVASNPTYTGKVTVPTLWDKKTKKIVNNEFVRDHPDAQHRVQRHHRRPDRLLSAGAARRDRRRQRARLSQRQQRRVSRGLRQVAGGLRGGLRRAVRHARLAGGAAVAAALSRRQPDHRGRLAAVPDAGALRRRLFLDLQVQPASASPTIRTCRTTCASSTRCRASPAR